MIKSLLDVSRYHWIIVFALAGFFAGVFAFMTYNLFHYSMANLSFLNQYGLMAVQEGALIQAFEILSGGALALICFFGFKLCESEMVSRFKAWTRPTE